MFPNVTVPGPAADDTPDGAQVLSFGPDGSALIEDTVGGDDPRDFYRFTLDRPSPVQLTLEGAGGNVDLYIFDEAGTLLGSSTNGSGEIDFLEGEAPAGTYYVRVEPADGTPTSYRLGVQTSGAGPTVEPIRPEVDPGHTVATAMQLTVQPGVPLVVQDQVGGGGDPADLYRFDLAEGQPVRIALQGDQGDVDLLLLDGQGNVIAQSVNGGLEIDNLEGQLAAGTYHVAVVPFEDVATTYSLSIEAGSILDQPSGMAAAPATPESLALRDQTGLGVGGAASSPFGQSQSESLATQLLAAA